MLDNQQVAENIEKARMRIAEYCKRCNRTEKPLLLAATKTVPVEQINFVIRECGITDIGENRVQELLEKYDSLDKSVHLHFIGRLQRNKVKYIIDKVCMIQSADSLPLIEEIEKQADKLGIVQDILLEVNIGGEAAKSGFAPEAVSEAASHAKELSHVRVRGLMTIPPASATQAENMVYFQKVHALYVDINQKMYDNELDYLSMGMSGDFADAIRAGSNMVRVGTAIFGARDYTK